MPSSNTAFRDTLKKGLGRAVLLLRADPESDELRAELIKACKTNLVYDRQCEEPRAPYLYRLIRETGQIRFFIDELLPCLRAPTLEGEEVDLVQVFQILCLAAANESIFDRERLREFLRGADFEGVGCDCISAFVSLDGLDGLLFCVRVFYGGLNENFTEEGGWVFQSLVDALGERDGSEVAAAAVSSARSGSIELDHLMSRKDLERPLAVAEERSGLDYATVKAELDIKHGFPPAWVKAAPAEELMQAADDLLAERDEKRVFCYLRVFWRRDFPQPPRTIFHLVKSSNRRIAKAATRALGK
jgi:hypothetical protein